MTKSSRIKPHIRTYEEVLDGYKRWSLKSLKELYKNMKAGFARLEFEYLQGVKNIKAMVAAIKYKTTKKKKP